MRILVLQTTRMGDVLQTSPLVRGIRERYPGAHIAVMVRRMGKAVAERHPDIDEVLVYEEDELYLDMKANDSDRLLHAYEVADQRIRELREAQFDLAYNLTHSIASAMLLRLANIPKVIGADISEDGQFVLRGAWTTYFFTSVFNREYNDLNLCDIARHFEPGEQPPRLAFEVHAADRAYVGELLERHGVAPGDLLIAMQLGASEENKRWNEAHFARLAQMLAAKLAARIVLVGVKEEAVLGETFAQHAPGLAIPLYGETSIAQLAALLERARLLVTNDTGTMHMAAAVGCPVTLVSVGHVHYRETGPYGEGHCAIEWRREYLGSGHMVPGGVEERSLVQPEHVLKAVDYTLRLQEDRQAPQLAEEAALAQVDLFASRFAPDGCLAFYPVIRRAATQRDLMRIAYRMMWLDHLGSKRSAKAERASVEDFLHQFEGPEARTIIDWQRELDGQFAGLADVARKGVKHTEELLDLLRKSGKMTRAREHVRVLMELDEEARIYGELNPVCRPLILIARFERDNLEGANPLALARTTLDIYRACYARAQLTRKKLEAIATIHEEMK